MAKIRIYGDTSGYVELAAPAVASDNTVNLGNLGKVLQVVFGSYSVETSSSSSTYADTGLTANITPSASTSKVLVIANITGIQKFTGNTAVDLKLLRGSTDLVTFCKYAGYTNSTAQNVVGGAGCTYLDSPSSTSQLTYKVQFASTLNTGTAAVQTQTSTSTIILVEVAA